jgi:hypothetical protein
MSETRTPTMSEWVDKHRETLGRLLCGNPDASFAAIIEAAKECAGLCERCGLNPRQVCVGCAMFAERSEPAAASVPLSAVLDRLRLDLRECNVKEETANNYGRGYAAGIQHCIEEIEDSAAPAVSREASVPQGGEFTAAEVEAVANACTRHYDDPDMDKAAPMLRAYARLLSVPPTEGTKSDCIYCMKPGHVYRHSGGYNWPMCDACRDSSKPSPAPAWAEGRGACPRCQTRGACLCPGRRPK